jgi:glycine oxidase
VTIPDIAVVGGGLLGRCLAWRAAKAGARVVLYDAASSSGEGSAAWVAAGMIAPVSEAIDCDPQIASMGRRSLSLWPEWLSELPVPVFYRDRGTIFVWHREEAGEAARVELALKRSSVQRVERNQVSELEPSLPARFSEALYIPGEAQVDNRELLRAVAMALDAAGVECHWRTPIEGTVFPSAGVIVDCRGMGAKAVWPALRGVRGEIVRLAAPEIELQHMVRLLDWRCPVYIVPRPGGRLVVGATTIESEDRSPVSVRGAIELLNTAHSVLPALAEARVLEFNTQVRPCLPDNLPAIAWDRARNVLAVNGLYRHGFLLTPAMVEEALIRLSLQRRSAERWPCLRDEAPACL